MTIYILTIDTCQYAFFNRDEAYSLAMEITNDNEIEFTIDEVKIYDSKEFLDGLKG